MKRIEQPIKTIISNVEFITVLLIVIVLQGCFGCNKCNHEQEKVKKQNTEFNFKEWWNEFKYQ
jgi:hypothetical protein